MESTKLFIVINEETLETMKSKEGKTLKFKTEEDANKYASSRLEIWVVVSINFKHKFLKHEL